MVWELTRRSGWFIHVFFFFTKNYTDDIIIIIFYIILHSSSNRKINLLTTPVRFKIELSPPVSSSHGDGLLKRIINELCKFRWRYSKKHFDINTNSIGWARKYVEFKHKIKKISTKHVFTVLFTWFSNLGRNHLVSHYHSFHNVAIVLSTNFHPVFSHYPNIIPKMKIIFFVLVIIIIYYNLNSMDLRGETKNNSN